MSGVQDSLDLDGRTSSDPFDGPEFTNPMAAEAPSEANNFGAAPRPAAKAKAGGKTDDLNKHSVSLWRKRGFVCFITQWFVAHLVWNSELGKREYMGGHRADLFGCMDGLAFHLSKPGLIGFQTTGSTHASDHIRKACKILAEDQQPLLHHWLGAGNRFLVLTWEKPGRNWQPTIYEITAEVVSRVHEGKRLDLKALIVEGGQGRIAA